MKTVFDYSPLFRSSVGFDRLFDLLANAKRLENSDAWPPYDIVKTGDDAYRIALAVAGFGQNELSVSQEENLLVVAGRKAENEDVNYLYRGIVRQSFERRFELADYVTVTNASLLNGMLSIDLVREVPEAMKPRKIQIQASKALPGMKSRQIEDQKQLA